MLPIAALLLAQALSQAEPAPDGGAVTDVADVYLAGPSVDVTRDVGGDLLAAGGTVRVGAPVAETALLVGGTVAVDADVRGDVVAVGGDVALRGGAQDARLAGGSVRLAGRVEDDATVAGGTIRIERDAFVAGRAWLAGGELVVAGTVGRELRAAGGHVSIDGEVRGDVHVRAESLEIGPTARIRGSVVHRGPEEPRIDPAARIGGGVEHLPTADRPPARALAFLASAFLVVALFATGAVMILVFPRFMPAAARTIGTDPLPSLGLGALAAVAVPAVIVALLVTGVGFPLGLILLAGYPVALLTGWLVGALFLGTWAARRLGRRRDPAPSTGGLVLRLLIALVVLWLLQVVPVVGGLISLAALLFGLGALLIQLHRTYRAGTPAEPIASARSP